MPLANAGTPSGASNYGPNFTDYEGETIIVETTGPVKTISTVRGDAPALPVRVLSVDNDADGWVSDLLVWGKVVQTQLADNPTMVGTLRKAAQPLKAGQSPPWEMAPVDEATMAKAQDIYLKHGVPF